MYEICGHLLSELLFLRLSSSIILLWEFVLVCRKHNFDMLAQDFRRKKNSFANGVMILIILICLFFPLILIAVSAFLNVPSVLISSTRINLKKKLFFFSLKLPK